MITYVDFSDGEERVKSNGERRSHRDKERDSREREMRYEETAKDRDREKDQRVREKEARSRDRASPTNGEEVPLKNGCCRPCMKAFSEHKRACLCQVPVDVRMGHLPEAGCKVLLTLACFLFHWKHCTYSHRYVDAMVATLKKKV